MCGLPWSAFGIPHMCRSHFWDTPEHGPNSCWGVGMSTKFNWWFHIQEVPTLTCILSTITPHLKGWNGSAFIPCHHAIYCTVDRWGSAKATPKHEYPSPSRYWLHYLVRPGILHHDQHWSGCCKILGIEVMPLHQELHERSTCAYWDKPYPHRASIPSHQCKVLFIGLDKPKLIHQGENVCQDPARHQPC